MSIALSEFWTRLVRSGITDAQGCKRLAMGFTKANGGTPPSDSKSLAKFMIASGELNTFQGRALIADQPVELRFGGYLLRGDNLSGPMSRWAEASRISDGQAGYLLRTAPNELSGSRAQWVKAHLEVAHPTLQAFDLEATPPTACVFSSLPAGRLLHAAIAKEGKLSARQTCQIGISLSDAMESLHARPLAHGAIRTDRVWLCDNGEAILLRDPSGPPVAPSVSAPQSSAGWFEEAEPPYGYAAPEFADSQQACDPSTDLYSLGCLLYRSVTGKLPVQSDSASAAIALHASETPPEIAKAVAEGEKGEPLFRVIAFAMAKSRDARFRSAGQLAAALRATLPLMKDEPKVVAQPKSAGKQESLGKESKRKASKAGQTKQATPAKEKAPKPKQQSPKPKQQSLQSKTVAKNSASEPKAPSATPKSKSKPPGKPKEKKPAESTRRDDVPPKQSSKANPIEATPSPPITAPAVPPSAPPESNPPQPPPAVSDSDPVAETSAASAKPQRTTRRRKKKKSKAPLILGALCVAVLMLIISLLVYDPSEANEEDPIADNRRRLPTVVPSVTGKKTAEDKETPRLVAPAGYTLTDSDRLLFVPPFADDENDAPLDLLPPGPAAILTVDLASITSSPAGSNFTESIDPELAGLLNLVARRSGVPIDSIRRCTAAFHAGKRGWPEVSLAIQLKDPQTLSELASFWKASPARTPDGATIYAGDAPDSDAYYIPDVGETVRRFAVGSVPRVSEVAADEGAAILLPRSLQQLWNSSSTEADFALLITPNFLFADGREMRSFDQTVKRWPAWAEEFIVESVPDASWRLLASRMPAMMRFVSDRTRVGVSSGAVVANTYLPANALSQLTVGTLLAMNTKPGGGAMEVAGAAPAKKLSMEELLARKMSVSFEQESLEFAIDAIIGDYKRNLPAGNVMPPVRIVGSDLQKMGITQNQQVRGFSKSDIPLRSVLTDLVVKANPDKSATGPRDLKQALIWVVAEDPENPGKQVILVTTRQAAEKKYELPSEFQPAE